MTEIKVPFTGCYEEHKKFHITFTPGITTLVGVNGAGKSSAIIELKQWLRKHDIPCFGYIQNDESRDVVSSMGRSDRNMEVFLTYFNSSEGQKIIVTYANMIHKLKRFLEEHKDDEIVFAVFDGIDSGLSINNVIDALDIFNLIIKDYPNVAIVNTANNYEFLTGTRCVNIKTGKDKKFKTYDAFKKFIIKQGTVE